MANYAIGNEAPPARQGNKLDNGFDEVYHRLRSSPNSWVSAHGLPYNVARSLKRAIKLSDIGDRTSVNISEGESGYTVHTRYLP